MGLPLALKAITTTAIQNPHIAMKYYFQQGIFMSLSPVVFLSKIAICRKLAARFLS